MKSRKIILRNEKFSFLDLQEIELSSLIAKDNPEDYS